MDKERRFNVGKPVPESLPADVYLEIAEMLRRRRLDLNRDQQRMILMGRAYLIAANEGIQWIDFDQKQNHHVRSHLQAYTSIRTEVMELLYPILFPNRPIPSFRLPDDTRMPFQRALSSMITVFTKVREGFPPAPEEERTVSLGVSLFDKLYQQALQPVPATQAPARR